VDEGHRLLAPVAAPPLGLRPAVEKNLSVVHRVDAREQLDERGLARAVLAQQREDLSGTHVQRDLVDRLRAAEALAHGPELQQRRVHARTAPLVFSRMR